jgi:thioredoxin 2
MAFDRLGHATRCANCHKDLSLPAAPQEVESSQQFDTLVARSSLPILVDFWAPWCGPCRMVAPQVEQVAQRNAGKLLVVKVNTDAVSDLATRLRIQSIPTLAVYTNGAEAARTAGVMSADRIEAFVRNAAG